MEYGSPRKAVARHARRLRELRERKGLTQEQLAARAGVVFQTVGKLERGELRLRVDQIDTFAEALEIDAWELLTDSPPAASLPVRYAVAAAGGEAPAWDAPRIERIAAPPSLPEPVPCFAAYVADRSADRIYPRGSLLIVRPLEALDGPLRVGAKVLVARYGTDAGTGDIAEILVGILDRSTMGDLVVALRSTDRAVAAAITVQPAHTPAGAAERFQPQDLDRRRTVDYHPHPGDPAEILGAVVMAITPE